MTSYCDVTNPTWHMEPALESCKVGDYSWRMYDDVVSSAYNCKKSRLNTQTSA